MKQINLCLLAKEIINWKIDDSLHKIHGYILTFQKIKISLTTFHAYYKDYCRSSCTSAVNAKHADHPPGIRGMRSL